MINARSFSLANILAALASMAPEVIAKHPGVNEIIGGLPAAPVRPRSNRAFPHRSGEGPRETARRRKQIAAGTLRISEARNA